MNTPASDLQLQLAEKIARAISEGSIQRGEHLREAALSEMFRVSRSPVRAALGLLLDADLVDSQANRGFFVTADKAACENFLKTLPKTDDEKIKETIARDWFEGTLPKDMSEGDIRKRYGLGRLSTQRILNSLSDDGVVSRMPGYGWQFEPTLNSSQAHDESYDFRLVVEPQCLLVSTFRFDRAGGSALRERHTRVIHSSEVARSAADLFALDEDFHNFIAKCSGNRFLVQSVLQQNRLRRLLEYSSLLNTGRLQGSCLEHLEILDELEREDLQGAAHAMTVHLQRAKDAGPDF
ncbi:GntR family transcriptional regulator [Hoeflea ulvae]|uniref:GntR family transcriptional regulator n=1 Tax=Hoeflea ulvae TaxID=2983764 RepID=A0ABT3YMB4_9HYPH|nr:GntR family transcriptional regulator [Hoeflea ulvae]MCY0097033.1 GntR family transcriptional regulator [Hoeflea ulvae]